METGHLCQYKGTDMTAHPLSSVPPFMNLMSSSKHVKGVVEMCLAKRAKKKSELWQIKEKFESPKKGNGSSDGKQVGAEMSRAYEKVEEFYNTEY